jgi:hypothetical protein
MSLHPPVLFKHLDLTESVEIVVVLHLGDLVTSLALVGAPKQCHQNL